MSSYIINNIFNQLIFENSLNKIVTKIKLSNSIELFLFEKLISAKT